MIAALCGSLDAVKLLVRRGAALRYADVHGPTNVMSFVQSEAVTRWLLVGRFSEQGRILPANSDSWRPSTTAPALRSGVAFARLRLIGKRERRPTESSLDYAKRLSKIRKHWQGKVVPVPYGLVYPICYAPTPPLIKTVGNAGAMSRPSGGRERENAGP